MKHTSWTFEDVDYKGDANMVGERNWSSLIDSQQYGTRLILRITNSITGVMQTTLFFASELPNGWGDYQYWGGGHAISNYLDMDLTHGDFQHQLAVYYQDVQKLLGGT